MAIFKVFEQLRLRKADNAAGYHLLGTESDPLEKADEIETYASNVEPNELSVDGKMPPKRMFALRCLRKLGVLLPSFIHPSSAHFGPQRLRPTAWLDGLRGVAALFVVLHHMSLIWFSWDIHNGWSDSKDHLIQLPIIRLIVSGRANVMVFFVISGYALSWKPLSLLQGDQQVKMYQGMASSIFRRHPRLFIPAIIICAPAPVIAYLGGYSRGEGMPGAAIQPMNPPRFDTIWEQFSHYARTLTGVSDMYTPNGSSWAYSDSLWTLPIEFKSSLVLFGLLIALSQCTTRARVVITSCVAIYTLWFFHWGEFLFIGGMLIVDVSLLCQPSSNVGNGRLDEDEDGLEVQRRRRPWPAPLRNRTTQRLCSSIALLAALFVLSMPEQGRGAADSWGFGTLVVLMPAHFQASGASDYFWQPLAAVLLVLVIDRARWLQRIFVTQLAQYLGRVSFALYLVHMLILHSLGFWLGKCFLELTGSESDWEYGTGVGMAAVVVGCVIIYAADLGSRFVDANAVRFTAWAYTRLRRHND